MPLNWKLYEQDIVRWYLDDDKTANETVKWLNDTHNLSVTLRQFKSKFGGLKNLRSDEWIAVINEIRKREARGIKSMVYLCDKRLRMDSTTRAIRRYSKKCQVEPSNIDLGIDTVREHRIEIRTPAESNAESASLHHIDASAASEGIEEVQESNDEMILTTSTDEFTVDQANDLDNQVIDPVQIEIDFSSQLAGFYLSGSVEESLQLSNALLSLQPDLDTTVADGDDSIFPRQEHRLQHYPACLQNGPKRPFKSFWDLPELSPLILETSGPQAADENQHDIPSPISVCAYTLPTQSRWVLSKLIDADWKLSVLEPVAELVEDIFGRTDSRQSLDSRRSNSVRITGGRTLFQVFSIVAYLISNNFPGSAKTTSFIEWVVGNGYLFQLSKFLQTAPADTLAFGSTLLRDICKFPAVPGLERFVGSGEFLSLVANHRLDLSGLMGTKLLHRAIEWDCLELARQLVSYGVDVNAGECSSMGMAETPLARAALYRKGTMVKFLIRAGADVNKSFSHGGSEATALALAIQRCDHDIVKILLDEGAHFNADQVISGFSPLGLAWGKSSPIYSMLCEKLLLSDEGDASELIDAATKGNRELGHILLQRGTVQVVDLERALCEAVKLGKVGAVGTFLRRGVDPDARLARLLQNSDKASDGVEGKRPIILAANCVNYEDAPDLIYLLIKAGAKVDDETAREIYLEANKPKSVRMQRDLQRRSTHCISYRILALLHDSGYNAAWVGPSLLVSAAASGRISDCGKLLEMGTPINEYGLNGKSSLQVAASGGYLPVVQFLLGRGADVNLAPSSKPNGGTALFAALKAGRYEVANCLIDSGADVTARMSTESGMTALEGLVHNVSPNWEGEGGFVATFHKLLALGAPVNRIGSTENTILSKLLLARQFECFKLALRAGVRTEDKFEGRTPLHIAASLGDMESIRLLLRHGANINATTDNQPSRTVSQSSRQLYNPFVGHQLDPCSTPLQAAIASANTSPQLIEFLVTHGANINAPPVAAFGRTALQAAVSSEMPDLETINLLLHHADVNAPPAEQGGVTALQGAAIQGHMEIVRILLAQGALINAPAAPEEGRTALEGAAEHGRLEMVRFLLSEGAMPDPIMGFSRAIKLAEQELHLGIAKLLRAQDPCNRLLTEFSIL
ncbi:hypothetical protein AUP68_05106 [Ilyonectria robusta]